MAVKEQYQDVLKIGKALNVQNGHVQIDGDQLQVWGTTKTPYEKNLIWDKIKEIGGEQPGDIKANITVADDSVYHRHTVKSGESLSLIAKHYYGDPMKYKAIFEANTSILSNPDVIHPDQELVIPNL